MRSNSSERLRILVVDDEREIRELLGEYLCARGNNVHTTSDGQEALQWLRDHPVDVLLTDVQMPTMGGVELISALNQDKVTIGIVVMTGFPTVETATAALKTGATDYLLKPFRLRDVYAAVVRAAGRGQAEQELMRLRTRASFYEQIIGQTPEQARAIIIAHLQGLLVLETGAEHSALWMRQADGDFAALLPPSGDLAALKPVEIVVPTLEDTLAAAPLPGGGVLAISGGRARTEADLERLTVLTRILAAALAG